MHWTVDCTVNYSFVLNLVSKFGIMYWGEVSLKSCLFVQYVYLGRGSPVQGH